jgi:LemA protein
MANRFPNPTPNILVVKEVFGSILTYMTIVLIIAIVLVLVFVFMYNSLVTWRNRVQEAWADIEVQLKRRYDLIPNLVNTVKGYAGHEAGTLEKVTEARVRAMGATTASEHAQAENMLSGALKSLFAVSEAYPDLKANTNFLELQRELSDTENKIQAARRFYNGNVRDFNTKLQVFPSNIIAKMFGFKTSDYFDIPDDGVESQPVEVKF